MNNDNINNNNKPLHFAVQTWGSVGSQFTWKKLNQRKIVLITRFFQSCREKNGCDFFFFFSNIVMWGQWFRQTLDSRKSHKSRRTPPHVHKQLRTLHPREEKQRDVKQANTINAFPPAAVWRDVSAILILPGAKCVRVCTCLFSSLSIRCERHVNRDQLFFLFFFVLFFLTQYKHLRTWNMAGAWLAYDGRWRWADVPATGLVQTRTCPGKDYFYAGGSCAGKYTLAFFGETERAVLLLLLLFLCVCACVLYVFVCVTKHMCYAWYPFKTDTVVSRWRCKTSPSDR